MYRFISLLLTGIFVITGCENNSISMVSGEKEELEAQLESEQSPNPQETEIIEEPQTPVKLFELSGAEELAYSNFQKDFDLSYLKGLEPLSIAKLYVQAGIDEKYDLQYALYTDREELISWSKEEDEAIPKADRGTKEQQLKTFNNIDNGNFIQTSEYEGYVEYNPDPKEGNGKSGFQLVMNEDGIWQVSFMAIQ